jgi:Fe-S-cluster-containing dehydrogenase component/DMSO reductase anchor subunit
MKAFATGHGLVGMDTAVDRFSGSLPGSTRPRAGGELYADLIPLAAPLPGEQYGFEVDLDRCTGCKACVVACHSLNGLAENEWWREAGTLTGEHEGGAWLQTVTSACHHCLDPGCAEGCPVQAYEKDAVTGVVRHLDDQCIGCRYCEMKCPYGVPKYRADLGIVRKCDLCVGRLQAGEAPACVQACPGGAIRVRKVSVAELRQEAPEVRMLPTAFPSGYTRPATRYVSSKGVALEAWAVGGETRGPEEAHLPLVWMLGLTQLALGLEVCALWRACTGDMAGALIWERGAAVLLVGGLVGAFFHLGRPLGAWRFFLGLRTSWMSREILAFNLAVPMVLGSACCAAFLDFAVFPRWAACGALGVAVWTSGMIYVDTRRLGWGHVSVFGEFLSTGMGSGVLAALALGHFDQEGAVLRGVLPWGAVALWGLIAVWVGTAGFWLPREVLRFRDRVLPAARWIDATWLIVTGALICSAACGHSGDLQGGILALVLATASLWRRYAFFVGTPAPRMPLGGHQC